MRANYMHVLTATGVLFAIATTLAAPLSSAVADPMPALRTASGCVTWLQIPALQITGSYESDGLTGTFNELIDIGRRRSAYSTDQRSFISRGGFDGLTDWVSDYSGASHVVNSPHALAIARTDAWLDSRGWCTVHDGTAYRSVGVRRNRGRQIDVMTATPPHGATVAIWIDRKSHLIDRTIERLDETSESTYFADWRKLHGVAFPFTFKTQIPEDIAFERFRIRAISKRPEPPKSAFAQPPMPHDFSIRGGLLVGYAPYAFEGQTPIVDVMLNGRGPFPFVLDTGGAFELTAATARRLGLSGIGNGVEIVAGEILKSRFTRIKELRIGNVVITNQPATITAPDFAWLERGSRTPVAGWLGLEIFERFATTFNPAKHVLTFEPLNASRGSANGSRLPVTFEEDAPLVPCTIDARSGVCIVDTGNARNIIVEGNWAARCGLSSRLQHGIRFERGLTTSRARVTVGSIVAPHELVEYSAPTYPGAETGIVEAALLSEDFINRFVMKVDYVQRSIWLSPIPTAVGEPFDRSGFEAIKWRSNDFVVSSVLRGSPAAIAGIEFADVIIAVNGIPARKLSNADLIEKNRGPVDAWRTYEIQRSGHTKIVKLRLRELLP